MRLTHLFTAAVAGTVAVALGGCMIVVGADGGTVHSGSYTERTVQGDGQYRSETRPVGTVDRIELQGPLQVEVRVGAAPSLTIEADGNLLPLIRTDSSAGMLKVWTDGSFRSDKPVRVVLTTPQLAQVRASGSGRLTVTGLHGGPLRLELDGSRKTVLVGTVGKLDIRVQGSGGIDAGALVSGSTSANVYGSGRLELGQVMGDHLQIEVQGSGGVRASGLVQSLTVRQTGSGDVDLNNLRSQSAELRSQGSGDINVAVAQALEVDSSGSGSVTVHGDPGQRNVRGRNVSIVQ